MTGCKFACIAADPPWLERGGGKIKRGADRHYPLMPTADIAALPMRRAAAVDAHLWLWVTDNFLKDGLQVMDAWGFRYVRTWVWVKGEEDGGDESLQLGLGQYGRNCHEQLLFGVRGHLPVPTPDRRPASVFHARRTVHSRKPARAYEIMQQVSPGPRLELFARDPRDGWLVLGNQSSGGDIRDDLALLNGQRDCG